jgi:hypothetical protein
MMNDDTLSYLIFLLMIFSVYDIVHTIRRCVVRELLEERG